MSEGRGGGYEIRLSYETGFKQDQAEGRMTSRRGDKATMTAVSKRFAASLLICERSAIAGQSHVVRPKQVGRVIENLLRETT